MFILADLQHTVQIEPEEMKINFEKCIIQKLNQLLANKVIKDVGLCITFYDFIKIDSSYIPQGAATIYVPVKFRYLVYVLIPGEVIDCFVSTASPEGIKMSTKFFEDIFVPKENLPIGSLFDHNSRIWNWHFKTDENEMVFSIDPGSSVRVLIESTVYKDVKADKAGTPMLVTANMNQPGLGCQKWWHDDEEAE
uniref:RNA polymerase III subunit Rpc25 domain-containing protein n=1 Tax=Panagrolaimus sp. JU765 TaxID=591449 RepID=A0AC34RJ60_9BILA